MKRFVPQTFLAVWLASLVTAQNPYSSIDDVSDDIWDKIVTAKAERAIPGKFLCVFNTTRVLDLQDALGELENDEGEVGVDNLYNELTMMKISVNYTSDDSAGRFEEYKQKLWRWLASGLIEYVEEDQTVTIANDQEFPPWGLDRIDQKDLPLNNQYHFDNDGSGVSAFIIDTGIRASHDDFEGRATCPISFVPGEDCNDGNGHGTHVSGTIGSSTFGVAKGVSLVGVKVLSNEGSGSNSQVISGINFVLQQALASTDQEEPKVCNLSLGGFRSRALDLAINRLVQQGGIFTSVAAGNESENACLSSPAAANLVMTVGATDENDSLSSFSNFGTCVDILAPGTLIESTWIDSDTDTRTISGTSMASPHVAGVAALKLQTSSLAQPSEIKAAILGEATNGRIDGVRGSPNLLVNTEASFETVPATPPQSGASCAEAVLVAATAVVALLL